MKLFKGNIEEVLTGFNRALQDKKSYVGYGFHEKEVVMSGQDGHNILYCYIHHIPVFKVPSSRGTIVAQKGDFSFISVINNPKKPSFTYEWTRYLIDRIKERCNDVEMDSNDLLINNQKAVGFDAYKLPDGRRVEMMSISLTVNKKRIKNVCLKKWSHEPIGLADFGLTQDIIEY